MGFSASASSFFLPPWLFVLECGGGGGAVGRVNDGDGFWFLGFRTVSAFVLCCCCFGNSLMKSGREARWREEERVVVRSL